MRDDTSSSLLWFVTGLGVGVLVGMLTAPQSGSETRRRIRAGAGEAGDYLAANSREYIDRGRELYERGRQLAEEASQLFDDGKRLMEEADAAEAASKAAEMTA